MKNSTLNLYVAILLICALIFSFLTIYSFGEEENGHISVSARAAVLYQPDSDFFLYEKHADTPLPMASTTKVMTALIALSDCELSDQVLISDEAVGTEGSSAYLSEGEILSVEELLYALMLQSANDAAVALAIHIGGSTEAFAELMNEKATELGLTHTRFENPHGLDAEGHFTTARELAIITAEAMKDQTFAKIVSTYKKSFRGDGRVRTYVNHNKLLKIYDNCIGVKTGFTSKSGRCLVGAADRDGLSFITVTLDAPSDWKDHKTMLDYGFDTMERITLCEKNEHSYVIPVIDGKKDSLRVTNPLAAHLITEKNAKIETHVRMVRYAVAPITKGELLGQVIYTKNGDEVARINILATETIKENKKSLIERLLSIFNQ